LAEIGSILGGRYRLIESLGQGGMATIYRAQDTQLGREVAVKLLRPEYLRDPDFGSRFRQEAQNAASLSHPNVVTVYDYGEDPSGPYIVMEYVDGEDLATILRRNGALPPTQAARVATGVALALESAHGRGIIHRDVKPGNVLIGRDGRVKVVDFGIARAIAEAQMTLPGTTLGSVHYFSPEQARGEPATTSSDIFALGIVLYEMLTGVRPWEGDSAAAVALARLTGPVPDPLLVRPSLPTDIAAIDRKAMAMEPGDRFASAGAMAEALQRTYSGGAAVDAAAAGVSGAVLGAAAAGGVAAAGVARSNPTVVSYPPDAYAAADDAGGVSGAGGAAGMPADRRPDDGPGAAVWIAGILAIGLLAVIAFLVFQLLSSSSAGPTTPDDVAVPNFVGLTMEDATVEADGLGIKLIPVSEQSDQPPGTVLAQDPPEGTLVAPGSEVTLTVAAGVETVPVPDLRLKTEAEAVQLLVAAELAVGSKAEDFDPTVPAGLIFAQSHQPGSIVAKGTAIDYTVSKGPEPTPSPTPTPTPSPTPAPTPSPTPAPTPSPTPDPTPSPPPDPTPSPPPDPTPTP
jgi:eukaryotic-like serine/threonine-protein kinase